MRTLAIWLAFVAVEVVYWLAFVAGYLARGCRVLWEAATEGYRRGRYGH